MNQKAIRAMTVEDIAVGKYLSGYACSQAILDVYTIECDLSHEQIMRIAAGFAGGMRLGETCGTVTGAVMVLGLKYALPECDTPAKRANVYERVLEFSNRFKERNGSLLCRELLGCDISTPEGMKKAQDRGLLKSRCAEIVRGAAEILEEMGIEGSPAQ